MADIKKPREDEEMREYLLGTHCIVWIGTICYFIYRAIFGDGFSRQQYWIGGAILVSWILIGFVIRTIVRLVMFYHQLAKLNSVEQSRNFLLIGLGGIMFFGFLPRVVVFFDIESVMWYCIHTSLGGISFFTFINISFINDVCEIRRSWTDWRSWALFLAHILLLVLIFKYETSYSYHDSVQLITYDTPNSYRISHQNNRQAEAILLCNIGFSIICAKATIDFYYVWRGMIKMTTKKDGESDRNSCLLVETNLDTDLRFNCKVCKYTYNRVNRIPRVLKECGHTICEGCVDKLLKNEQFLKCPFCQNATLVKGPAQLLPKNYALLDYTDMVKDHDSIEEV